MSNYPWSFLPLVSFPCSFCFQDLSNKKKLNNHFKYIHKEAPDTLPLATLPCLPEQCSHRGKNFSRKSGLSKHMLEIHGASNCSKILQYRYLAKLMARRRTSYITVKTRISFK